MYTIKYHKEDLSQYCFLITGRAGFIGSKIVEYLLKYNAKKVRVLDNLSNGHKSNIESFLSHSNFEFIEGDIRDLDTCKKIMHGVDLVSHQAALGSVPRSINDPATTNAVNISGFLNMLNASANKSIKANYGPSKTGDVRGSLLGVYKANKLLGYKPEYSIKEELDKTWNYFKKHIVE